MLSCKTISDFQLPLHVETVFTHQDNRVVNNSSKQKINPINLIKGLVWGVMVHLGNQNYMTKTRKILDFVNVMSCQLVVTDISGLTKTRKILDFVNVTSCQLAVTDISGLIKTRKILDFVNVTSCQLVVTDISGLTKTRKILDFVNVTSCQLVVTDISGLHIITIFRFKHQEGCLTCS
jgi:hypothetical protein